MSCWFTSSTRFMMTWCWPVASNFVDDNCGCGKYQILPPRKNDFNRTIYVTNSRKKIPIKNMDIWLDISFEGYKSDMICISDQRNRSNPLRRAQRDPMQSGTNSSFLLDLSISSTSNTFVSDLKQN